MAKIAAGEIAEDALIAYLRQRRVTHASSFLSLAMIDQMSLAARAYIHVYMYVCMCMYALMYKIL